VIGSRFCFEERSRGKVDPCASIANTRGRFTSPAAVIACRHRLPSSPQVQVKKLNPLFKRPSLFRFTEATGMLFSKFFALDELFIIVVIMHLSY
jgi:alpha-D-ribose 1-methylphosphonate 5-phosphate C-P lyase